MTNSPKKGLFVIWESALGRVEIKIESHLNCLDLSHFLYYVKILKSYYTDM